MGSKGCMPCLRLVAITPSRGDLLHMNDSSNTLHALRPPSSSFRLPCSRGRPRIWARCLSAPCCQSTAPLSCPSTSCSWTPSATPPRCGASSAWQGGRGHACMIDFGGREMRHCVDAQSVVFSSQQRNRRTRACMRAPCTQCSMQLAQSSCCLLHVHTHTHTPMATRSGKMPCMRSRMTSPST